jgi:hypothetical protein
MLLTVSASALADDVLVPPQPSQVTAPSVPAEASCTSCIPALMPVMLSIDAELGSKLSKTGDQFPLHLTQPIVLNGREVIAAGAAGLGEVIHAKKAGGSGSPGELVLAAHFISIAGRELKLRSMRIALAGQDAIHTVDAVNAASVVSPLPIGLIGFAITGRNIEIPRGTLAVAKVAEPFLPGPIFNSKLEVKPFDESGAIPASH